MKIHSGINLHNVRQIYIAYLAIKTQFEDWHGVQDIAAELATIDALIAAAQVYPQPEALHVVTDPTQQS